MKNIHIIKVNLTNWREKERTIRKIHFLSILGLVATISVLLAGILPMFYYGHLMDQQQDRNNFLEEKIKQADKKIIKIKELKETKENLLIRMNIIEQLQQSRSAIVHYFKEITETVPDGIYITLIQQDEQGSKIEGVATSNSNISKYMVNLDKSDWIKNPKLIIIKRDENSNNIEFSLSIDNEVPIISSDENKNSMTTPISAIDR